VQNKIYMIHFMCKHERFREVSEKNISSEQVVSHLYIGLSGKIIALQLTDHDLPVQEITETFANWYIDWNEEKLEYRN